MSGWCEGSEIEVRAYYDNLDEWNDISVQVTISIGVVISLTASFFIFCKKRSSQRPIFVTLQMLLQNSYWIIYQAYWILTLLEIEKTGPNLMKDGRIENSVQTVANLAFLVQDWLYTEKFLSSALTLPIVLDMIIQKGDQDERREKAIRIFKAVRISFYIILAIWFVTSMILISFTVRMA